MKAKSGKEWAKLVWLVTVTLLAMVGIFSCEQTTGPVDDDSDVVQKLLIYSDASSIPSNGGLAHVLVKVYTGNDTTNVVSNVHVQFSTNFGSVQIQNDLTDAGGYARAVIYGGAKSGSLVLTASIENYANTISLSVTPGTGLISASPSQVLADGRSQSMVAATVVDSLGQPVAGALVRFVTTAGTITAQSYSNDLGRAEAVLRSAPSATDVSATVTATTVAGKIAELAEASNEGEAIALTAAKPAAGQVNLGSTTVVFKGITISGLVGKTTVFANNADSTLVKVTVKETTSGAPVPNARLTFTTTHGSLRSPEAVTDAAGSASVVLFGDNVSGVAVVKAALAEDLAWSTEVSLTKQLFMTLVCTPSTLAANGSDISTVKAQITDADGNPVQGEKVYFSTSLGAIQPSADTDLWGFAKVELQSARVNGRAEVRAKYRTIEKTTSVEFTGASIKVQATPMILVANDTDRSTVTVTLNDASGVPIVDGKVSLSTTKGVLVSGDSKSSGAAIVDSTSTTGKITVYLKSGEPGDAVVSIIGAGISESVTVHFTEYTFTLTSSEPQALAGGGKVRITAALRNKNGDIAPIGMSDVTFSTTLGAIVPVERTSDGRVVAELTSGNSAGTATVTASMKEPSISSSLSVPFVAASADSVVIRADRMSVQLGGSTVDVRATVYDVTGNPKAGAAVTFSILKGPGGGEEITPGSVVTNDRGQAVVTFKSGNRGSSLEGVEIQARVEEKNSNILKLTIAGEPYSVVLGFNTTFTANDDGTYGVGVSAIVSDVNRNKVIDNTIVDFSITSGDVGIIDGQVPTLGGVASTVLIYSPSDAGKDVEITASSGGIIDKKVVKLPGKAGTVGDLRVSPEESTILADGISTAPLVVYLSGMSGEPLSNQSVHCELLPDSRGVGRVDPTALTGDPSSQDSSPGKATVVYTSGASANDRRVGIRIYSGDKADTVYVNLKGVTISASSDPEILPPDGQSQATISVLVKETTTHVPIAGAQVLFGASLGYIGGKAVTDANGVARTTFTAPKDPTVTSLNPLTANILISFGAKLDVTIPLTIREIRTQGLELFASPTQIPANGTSASTITALLRDNNSNPVVGEVIRFVTDLGTITAVDSTDANGRAYATLVSDRRNGQAHVTAIFKNSTRIIPVNFTGAKLTVSATPENLFAGGNEKTTVTAFVKDAAEVAIVGETVSFEWFLDGVRMNASTVETDVAGRAQVSIAATAAGRCLIRVSSAGVTDSTAVTFNQMQLTLTGKALSPANGDTLAASTGGDSIQVSARLYDTVNNRYIAGAAVEFYTTLGSIGKNATTDSRGIASTWLQSGNTAGVATVLATTTYQGQRVSKESQFTFVANREVGKVTLRVDPNTIAVGGAGSALVAVVTDKYGNPIPDAMVNFKILQGPAGGEFIHPITSTTGPSGVAATYFYSGQVPSAFENVHLQAEVGGVASNIANLTIAGAPETIQPSYPTSVDLDEIDNGDGTFTLPVSATILDINSNHVVDGTTVYFKINPPEGTVASPVKSVNSVAVSSITYPATSAGRTVELTASAGGKEGKISIPLPGFNVSYLSVTANPKTIIADGKSVTEIKATLFDDTGSSANVPDGTTISFTTDGGTLNPVVATTKNGVAVTTLTSDKTAKYVTVTAQSGKTKDVTYIQFAEVVAYMAVSATPRIIPSNGIAKTQISATLFNNVGEIVPDGTLVTFSTTGGTLSSKTANTVAGVATVSLTSDTTPMDVTVTASSGQQSDTVDVDFRDVVSYLTLSATPNSIVADGTSTCEIKATLKDSMGDLVPDGTVASFTTTDGTLGTDVVKTVGGIARTTLTSSKAPGAVTVSVQVGTLRETATVTFEEIGSSVNQVAEIGLSVSDSVIEADGKTKSYITATLYRYNQGVKEVVDVPTTVVFESDVGDISRFVQSDATGKAVAQFTSGVVGTASISAKVGTVSSYTNVIMVPGAPQSIQLTFNPTTVGVKQSGRNETLKISAKVVDSKGNDVADGKLVRFELIGAFDDSVSVTPNDGVNHFRSVPVPTVNGVASVSFHSGTRAGTMRVKATVVDSTGAVAMPIIASEATQFQVLSGPAFLDTSNLNDPFRNSRMTLAGGPLNIFAGELNTTASKSTITVLIGDRYRNPVPEGTAVYFTTTGGIITSKTGFTNADGLASVTLYAGNPFPRWADSSVIANPNKSLGGPTTFTMPGYDFDGNGTMNDGVATVTAYTEGVDQLGRQVTVWNYVPIVFSKEVSTFQVTPESVNLLNGSSTVIHVKLHDSNGNPVVGGSTLDFSTTLGTLSASRITTNALGGTNYTVTLTNDIDPVNATPGNTVVTVKFKGANGEETRSTVPIYMDTRTQ